MTPIVVRSIVQSIVQGVEFLALIAAVTWFLYLNRATVAALLLKIEDRGWIAIASWVLTLMVFAIMVYEPDLLKSDVFKILASAIVITGFVNLVLAFYFTASKPQPPTAPGS